MTINGEANGNKTPDLLGVRAAARAVSLNPSTVSRYLKDHPQLNLGDEKHPKVDVAALRQHRAENVNAARSGSWAGRLLGEGEVEAPPAATRSDAPPNYAHAKAVRETVLAQRARVDLDEKRGLLVPRAEVEDAVYDAGLMFQRDLLELGPQLAERLAAMTDPKKIAEVMQAEYRQVLATWASSLRADVAAEEVAKTAATGEVIPIDERRP